jgi:hypothetical protein
MSKPLNSALLFVVASVAIFGCSSEDLKTFDVVSGVAGLATAAVGVATNNPSLFNAGQTITTTATNNYIANSNTTSNATSNEGSTYTSSNQSIPASAQSCVDQMSASTGVISGAIPPEKLETMCQSRVDVSSQLNAFNECSRVYVCAIAASEYAIENIASYGGDCTAAANAGLAKYPVQ